MGQTFVYELLAREIWKGGGTEDTESAVWSPSLYVLLRYLGKKHHEEKGA